MYKFQAYTGLQNGEEEELIRPTTGISDNDLETAAGTEEESALWKQLSQDMKHILASITAHPDEQWSRQHQHETGYEIYRLLCHR